VPLSDAARRLLAARGTRNPPAAPPPPVPKPEPEREPDRTGYRERAQRENDRFRLATDSEYWLCFCFRTPRAAAAFTRALGITPDGRYIPGPALAAAVTTRAPEGSRARRMLAARAIRDGSTTARLATAPPPDPLGQLPAATAIEQASLDEHDAILTTLSAPPDPDPPNVLDSPHWITAYWPHRDAKDEWLTSTGFDVLGDKYADGHQAARLLGLDLKEG
jgi:hypothetical protein